MVAWRQAATGEAWQEVRRATEDKWSGRRGRPARGKAQMQWFHMGINGASKREKKIQKIIYRGNLAIFFWFRKHNSQNQEQRDF